MPAGVDETLDLARVSAGDDHTAVDDPVDVVITGFGDLLLATGHLPYARPHLFFFPVKEVLADVALHGKVIISHVGIVLNTQVLGHLYRLKVEQVLPGSTDEATPVSLLFLLCIRHCLSL